MVSAKNEKTKKVKRSKKNSRAKKPVVEQSRLARQKKFSKKSFGFVRKTIMTVIVLAMMAVILALLVVFFLKPENAVVGKIEDMARDYYENHYYDLVLESASSDEGRNRLFAKYEEKGFEPISLRRLAVFDSRKYADAEKVIYNYCDPDLTSVKIYPVAPYSRTDYRVEYDYSACMF